MTRENKLALIVGFGLVLFVGILVSDHLSTARRQSAAVLRPSPTAYAFQTTTGTSGWFRFNNETSPPAEATDGPVPPSDEPLPVSTEGHSPHHVVTRGDTLQRICQRHYGEASLARSLAEYNRLPDPDRLTPQTRLLLPPRRLLITVTASTPSPSQSAPVTVVAPAEVMGEYIVKPGDTLSELAERLLGSSRDMQRLFKLNQHVLRDVDDLQTGAALRYPLDH